MDKQRKRILEQAASLALASAPPFDSSGVAHDNAYAQDDTAAYAEEQYEAFRNGSEPASLRIAKTAGQHKDVQTLLQLLAQLPDDIARSCAVRLFAYGFAQQNAPQQLLPSAELEKIVNDKRLLPYSMLSLTNSAEQCRALKQEVEDRISFELDTGTDLVTIALFNASPRLMRETIRSSLALNKESRGRHVSKLLYAALVSKNPKEATEEMIPDTEWSRTNWTRSTDDAFSKAISGSVGFIPYDRFNAILNRIEFKRSVRKSNLVNREKLVPEKIDLIQLHRTMSRGDPNLHYPGWTEKEWEALYSRWIPKFRDSVFSYDADSDDIYAVFGRIQAPKVVGRDDASELIRFVINEHRYSSPKGFAMELAKAASDYEKGRAARLRLPSAGNDVAKWIVFLVGKEESQRFAKEYAGRLATRRSQDRATAQDIEDLQFFRERF